MNAIQMRLSTTLSTIQINERMNELKKVQLILGKYMIKSGCWRGGGNFLNEIEMLK